MILRSLRLKNVKSFGTGPTGDGLTVEFQRGINRIAGRNGDGKTTLIEAAGYALFMAEPEFSENFTPVTYLLRTGTTEGEIDVTFEQEGTLYRIERGLGSRSKRRSKVIHVADGSIEAEGDKEVASYLGRLLRIEETGRLADLFAKLVGVKQGRLTLPFDQPKSAACKYFEPMLEVEIFRRCYQEVWPAVKIIDDLKRTQEQQLAAVTQKVADRADSAELLEAAIEKLEKLGKEIEVATAEGHQLGEQLEAERKRHAEVQAARNVRDAAHAERTLAEQAKQHAATALAESEQAEAVRKETAASHEAYLRAEKELGRLLEAQRQKQVLEKKNAELTAELARALAEITATEKAAAQAQSAIEARTTERNDVASEIVTVRTNVEQLDRKVALATARHQQAQATRTSLAEWIHSLQAAVASYERSLLVAAEHRAAISAQAATEFATAKEQETALIAEEQKRHDQITSLREQTAIRSKQLAAIGGGVCPFLQERCLQFDPSKIQKDVQSGEAQIAELTQEKEGIAKQLVAVRTYLENMRSAVSRAEHAAQAVNRLEKELTGTLEAVIRSTPAASPALTPVFPLTLWDPASLESWVGSLRNAREIEQHANVSLQEETRQLEALRGKCVEAKTQLTHLEKSDKKLETEIAGLRGQLEREQQQLVSLSTRKANAVALQQETAKALVAYEHVEALISGAQREKNVHAEGHQRFTAASAAEFLPVRKEKAREATEKCAAAESTYAKVDAAARKLEAALDVTILPSLESRVAAASTRLATLHTEQKYARTEWEKQQERHAEWKAAAAEQAAAGTEIRRLEAAMELGKTAREVLRDAAPRVAQHLCDRIANAAQAIFNRIAAEPVQLSWSAENYSMRIAPGDRRFAMLSGGEQTKLAVAMTLAMIEEFSALRFCIFDEPTYGVDGNTRQLLAAAIASAHQAAGFEQMLLVSHDDCFDEHVEHVVTLEKRGQQTCLA